MYNLELKENSYFVIRSYMRTKLKLNIKELVIYGIINGFCKKKGDKFTGSLQYLSEWTGLSKKPIMASLNSLVEKKLIVKEVELVNKVKNISYSIVNLGGIGETPIGIGETPTGVWENLPRGMGEMTMGGMGETPINNTILDNTIITKDNNLLPENVDKEVEVAPETTSKPKTKKQFVKPTLEELKEFITNENLTLVDPSYFIDYYEANGWLIGKTKMKDWKATCRNWQRRAEKYKKENKSNGYNQKPSMYNFDPNDPDIYNKETY